MTDERATSALSESELYELLDERRTVVVATIGADGQPHVAALWSIRDGDRVLAWTYGTSQKVRNLRRDPRATLLMEAGDSYSEIRGASLDCDVEIISDPEEVGRLGARLHAKFAGKAPAAPDGSPLPDPVRRQVAKRVALIFQPRRVRTWDHRKLAAAASASARASVPEKAS